MIDLSIHLKDTSIGTVKVLKGDNSQASVLPIKTIHYNLDIQYITILGERVSKQSLINLRMEIRDENLGSDFLFLLFLLSNDYSNLPSIQLNLAKYLNGILSINLTSELHKTIPLMLTCNLISWQKNRVNRTYLYEQLPE